MEINLEYPVFKDLVLEKGLLWQYVDRITDYFIFVVDGPVSYSTKAVKDSDDATDFETNYKANSNRPYAVTPTGFTADFVGKNIDLDVNTSSGYCEWAYDETVFLDRALPIVIDAEWGDKLEFTIHLKANDYEVKKYARDIYCYGNAPHGVWFQGLGSGEVPDTCKVRCTYTKAAGSTTARKCIIIAEFQVAP